MNGAGLKKIGICIALTVVLGSTLTDAIKCYHCSVKPAVVQRGAKEMKPPCQMFTPSKEYEIECGNSTYCMKQTYNFTLLNGSVTTVVQRECAPQTAPYQVLVGNKWQRKVKVQEDAYEEGCIIQSPDHPIKTTPTEYCYCSKNLCNSGKSTHDATSAAHTDAMAVIFVFNAMKYIRSLR
ncbi:uncharacterized protein LOC132205529 [Neocloeon triangulifer]|uniref:uncharacterized protein LOC132205529 n=1 Tax=Neocloeon triangulifer TaxID=2078957 RepID=UPI00286F4736|nr:uncharacterized protein LOC132205529 [Neocloeon triangulifer]XP_059490607.1 uncharacterized protein LOC132205529 [Neocloeon triangulifer]